MSRLTVSMKSRTACTLSTFSVSAAPRCWNMSADLNTTAKTMNMTTMTIIISISENPRCCARPSDPAVVVEIIISSSHSNDGAHIDGRDVTKGPSLRYLGPGGYDNHLGAVRGRSLDHIAAHFVGHRRIVGGAASHIPQGVTGRDVGIGLGPVNRSLIGQVGSIAAVSATAAAADYGRDFVHGPGILRSRAILNGIGQ